MAPLVLLYKSRVYLSESYPALKRSAGFVNRIDNSLVLQNCILIIGPILLGMAFVKYMSLFTVIQILISKYVING